MSKYIVPKEHAAKCENCHYRDHELCMSPVYWGVNADGMCNKGDKRKKGESNDRIIKTAP